MCIVYSVPTLLPSLDLLWCSACRSPPPHTHTLLGLCGWCGVNGTDILERKLGYLSHVVGEQD